MKTTWPHKSLWALIFLFFIFFIPIPVKATPSPSMVFNQLADEFFDSYLFPYNPYLATQLGVHAYDERLKNYSQSGIKKNIQLLKQFESRVNAINPALLNERLQGDRELILNYCRSELLTMETIRPWEKNPAYYSNGITRSAYVLMKRKFASVNDRLRVFIEREKLMPAVLNDARQNLQNPPKIYTEMTIEQLPGIINYFKKDVPAAFSSADDSELKRALNDSNANVVTALSNYQTWLKKNLLPHSQGDFRIGAEAFRKKLQYDEMVDTPLEQLLVIGYNDLHRNQEAYKQIEQEFEGSKLSQYPLPDQLLPAFSNSFDGLLKFIQTKNIITIPSAVRPIMQETPPFLRATSTASMDTPGPFESTATEAYVNVTLPKVTWKKEKITRHMRDINYPSITITSIHEAYPGHYVQFLWMNTIQDRVRQILGAKTNSEGWAHYCEQMMLDEGYNESNDIRDAKILRLGQLRKALLRDARFIVGIKMHTGNMTFEEAIDFFVKEGYQSRATGQREVKRGTSDPTYLYYTLGKLQILKLRADLQEKEGDAFNLQRFHDDFMRQGRPPIKIVRRALLGEA